MNNIILQTDSYKLSHWKMYPKDLEYTYSYLESRGGDFKDTLFFGLQYYLTKYLAGQRVTAEKIDEAENFTSKHISKGVFNREGWEHILREHGGRLPVRINAVPEGTVWPVGTPLVTVTNTDFNVPWLTSYLETLLLKVWYPTTVATLSREFRKLLQLYTKMNGDDSIDFRLHDFGYRGTSSEESAALGGAAHLLNFSGTDTIAGIDLLQKYYGADMPGFSVPAAEHSTIMAFGPGKEEEAFTRFLEEFPEGILSIVSDTYNIFDCCQKLWGDKFKDQILNRKGSIVIRPDSGDPTTTLLKILQIFEVAFRDQITTNSKGHKVLPPQLRIIQGDGIDLHRLEHILFILSTSGWSIDNFVFGCGGGLLQKVNRDTQQFAFKCSNVIRNGEHIDVWKRPIGQSNKVSKSGRFESDNPLLRTVFLNGKIVAPQTFEEVKSYVGKFL